MTSGTVASDRLSIWCGWVLVCGVALTPLIAWLSPLGFAPLLAVMGLLSLPAVRVGKADRMVLAALLGLLVLAVVSSLWSPFHSGDLGKSTALKLALQLPLYWAAVCGARRADPAVSRLALRVLAWGMAVYGVLLLAEALTGGAVYRALCAAANYVIEPAWAMKNIAQGVFVLALLWPLAAVGGARAGAPVWLALPMVVGTAVLAKIFFYDAPVLSLGLAAIVLLTVWFWPRAPKVLSVVSAAVILFMPAVVLAIRAANIAPQLQLSWSQRVGYWIYADARIHERPLGWGLDASRTFTPHIQLHPHNGALQIWLELGVVGAVLAAVFWLLMLRGLSRETRSLPAAAGAASAAVYLLFGLVSFGVWQEWWLALGALAAVVMVAAQAADAGATPVQSRRRRQPAGAM